MLGFGFRAQGLGIRDWGLGIRNGDLRLAMRVQDSEYKVEWLRIGDERRGLRD